MPLPLAHALVGGSLGVALWPERTPAELRRALAVGALLGIAPDVDFVLGWLHVLGWGWHHGFTHSIAFAIAVGTATAWALGLRGWRRALPCVLAILSHPVLDFVITESRGVALWWPVTAQRYKLGIDALSYYHITSASEGTLALVTLAAAELVLFGPVFAATLAIRGRRAR